MHKRILFILSVCLLTALPAFSQTTTITATHIAEDVSGSLLDEGQFCLVPVNQQGIPSAFQVSGTQYQPQQTCWPILNGAISGVSVPDTSMSNPAVGYQVTIESAVGNHTYSQPIYPYGATWSFDTWSPSNVAIINNPTTVTYGTSAPQGRCGTAAAIWYTSSAEYHCVNQVWIQVTNGTGGGAFVGGTLTSALYLFEDPQTNMEAATKHYVDQAISAIPGVTSGQISSALGGAPATQAYVSSQIASVPTVTSVNIINALGYTPLSTNDLQGLLPESGGSMTGTLNLSDGYAAASQNWVTQQINAAVSATGGTGGGGTGGGTSGTWDNGIGTVVRSGSMSDGTVAAKTCYVTGTVCSGGVGYNPPAATPTKLSGQSTPNANSGTSNAVAIYTLSTAFPKNGSCYTKASPNALVSSTQCYTEALWTTTNSGLGVDTTSTNWARDFWVKASMPAGIANLEFDTYDFDGTWDYMGGTECEYGKYIIQYDNQSNGWVDTAIPCATLYDGNWHHVQQTFHRDLASTHNCAGNTAPCLYWDDIWIDSKLYVIGQKLPATSSPWTGSGGQIQFDLAPNAASSGSPATGVLYVDTDTVTMGLAETGGTSNPGGNGGTTSGTGELLSLNFDGGTLPTGTGFTTVGTPAIVASPVHSSPDAASFPAGNNYIEASLSNPTNTIYTRQYIQIGSIGSNSNGFLRLYHGGAELMSFYLSASTGNLSYFSQAANSGGTMSSSGFTTGTYHLVEIYTKLDPTAGQIICKVDGTTVFTSAANLNTGSSTADTIWFGQIGGTAPVGWGATVQDNVDASAVTWVGPI